MISIGKYLIAPTARPTRDRPLRKANCND